MPLTQSIRELRACLLLAQLFGKVWSSEGAAGAHADPTRCPALPSPPAHSPPPAAGSRLAAWRLLHSPVCTCFGRGRARCAEAMSPARKLQGPVTTFLWDCPGSETGRRPWRTQPRRVREQGAPARREECLSHRHMPWKGVYSSPGKGPSRPHSS